LCGSRLLLRRPSCFYTISFLGNCGKMLSQIEAIRENRAVLLEQLEGLTTEQLNQIVKGFNNNIVWNLGHMITVQQGICYKNAGLSMLIGDDFWHRFKPGSVPQGMISVSVWKWLV
jgi:DinB superfamily